MWERGKGVCVLGLGDCLEEGRDEDGARGNEETEHCCCW